MAESVPPLPIAADLPADLATATAEEITAALSYALRYDERCEPMTSVANPGGRAARCWPGWRRSG
jgi:hypothetical protein